MFKRLIASIICITFSFSNLQYVHAQDFSINQLPVPGTMVGESLPFAPLALKGLIVNPQKPLEFQFIVDTGKGPQDTPSIKEEANQLVKYFLAGLTIPEGDLWVNLSPYEKNRMVPAALGQTDLGRDLLAQDYILKQLTASLIYPEKDLGKEFWSRVYAKAQAQFGTTNVPVNTFNKVWILPNEAQVYENVNAAYVTKSTLKVMLDEDYLSIQKHNVETPFMASHNRDAINRVSTANDINTLGSQIVRQIILPEIEKEINTGKNFAPLRQIYQALILAKWYKETIQNGLLDAVYTNKNKVAGVNLADPAVKEQIYERYLKAYKKGAFNYIKEDPTPDGRVVPRKYFSGGFTELGMEVRRDGAMSAVKKIGALLLVTLGLASVGNQVLAQTPPQTPFGQVQPASAQNNTQSANSGSQQKGINIIITSDANYDFYWKLVSDLIERDALQRDSNNLSEQKKSRLTDLKKQYPNEKILSVHNELVGMIPLPDELEYVDGNGVTQHIVLKPPLSVSARRLEAVEDNARNADLQVKAYKGEEPRFTRGGVIFNKEEIYDGTKVVGGRIGDIRGSEDDNLLDKIWKAVDALPIKERAFIMKYRLINNVGPLSSFHLMFDVDGKGKKDVLVSVISPLHKEFVSPEITDHENGDKKRLIISEGLVRYVVTDREVTKIKYDPSTEVEVSTTTYVNTSDSMEAFLKVAPDAREGLFKNEVPIAETATAYVGYTDPYTVTSSNIDPYKRDMVKRTVDYRTGVIRTETYGLFNRPIEVADSLTITTNSFNGYGIFDHSETYKNIGTIQQPKRGEKLFENKLHIVKADSENTVTDNVQDLKEQRDRYMSWVYQKDVVHSTERFIVLDNINWYREAESYWVEVLPDGRKLSHTAYYSYDEKWGNLVPAKVELYINGKLTIEDNTTGYDVTTGIRTANRTDLINGGPKTEATYDPRYEEPVETLVKNLIEKLRNGQHDQLDSVMKELTNIGKPAIHGLQESLKNEDDPFVRSAVEDALKKLKAAQKPNSFLNNPSRFFGNASPMIIQTPALLGVEPLQRSTPKILPQDIIDTVLQWKDYQFLAPSDGDRTPYVYFSGPFFNPNTSLPPENPNKDAAMILNVTRLNGILREYKGASLITEIKRFLAGNKEYVSKKIILTEHSGAWYQTKFITLNGLIALLKSLKGRITGITVEETDKYWKIDLTSEKNLISEINSDYLIPACRTGDINEVKLLIQNGANVNTKSKDGGLTPLMTVSSRGHVKLVELLLAQKGIDIEAKDNQGKTALAYARGLGQERIADILIKAGAKDWAQLTTPGGIDLNKINVLRKGKTTNVQFDPAQLTALQQGGFQGFTPVIINITRISSPFQLLGIKEPKQPELLAKA